MVFNHLLNHCDLSFYLERMNASPPSLRPVCTIYRYLMRSMPYARTRSDVRVCVREGLFFSFDGLLLLS